MQAHEAIAGLQGDAEPQAANLDNGNEAQVAGSKKKKKKGNPQSAAKRGPTALPKNRGTGFEGVCALVTSVSLQNLTLSPLY